MVRIEKNNDVVTAYIYGEIDHHSARQIREEIDTYVQRVLTKELLLDFKDVSFMDSSGIGLVMGRYKLIKSLGGELKVINTKENIKRVMRLAGLDMLAEIKD